jgi:hypothetical protein
VIPTLEDEVMRSFRSTQHIRASLLAQTSLLPDTSSFLSSWLPSSSLLVSSVGESVRQYNSSLIRTVQETATSLQSVFASRLIPEMCGISEMAAQSALAQVKAIAPSPLLFFQKERQLLQDLLPPASVLESLFPPVPLFDTVLAKSLFSPNSRLLQHISDLSHQLNASLVRLTQWLPEWLKLRLLAAFRRAKLCLAPSLPEDVTYRIVDYVEAGDLRPVTMLLWSHYARNRHAHLRQAVSSWFDHPEFAARKPIFEEALASHCDGRYVASIRMLTPEIEGLGSATVCEHRLHALNKHGKDIGLRLGKTTSVITRMIDAASDADPGFVHGVRVRSTQNYLAIFVAETDFEGEYDRIRNNRDVNRHGVAHGFQIQGYTWLNSLRLFLLLDTLHSLLQVLENRVTTSDIAV